MSESEKKEKIILFTNYLASKFNHRIFIKYSTRQENHYHGRKNTISLSIKELEENSIQETFYIIAHEYKHALLSKEKDVFTENLWFISKFIPHLLLFIISFFLHYFFNKENIWFYVYLAIIGLPLTMLINHPFWYNERILRQEELCDEFANKVVGGGKDYWLKKMNNQMDEKLFLKIQNILTLGLYSPTHPTLSTRLDNAKKYNLNEELNNILKDV